MEINIIPNVKGILLSFTKSKEKRLGFVVLDFDLGSLFFLKVFILGVSEAILIFLSFPNYWNIAEIYRFPYNQFNNLMKSLFLKL